MEVVMSNISGACLIISESPVLICLFCVPSSTCVLHFLAWRPLESQLFDLAFVGFHGNIPISSS